MPWKFTNFSLHSIWDKWSAFRISLPTHCKNSKLTILYVYNCSWNLIYFFIIRIAL
jgi:hypothetical protein